MHSWFSLGLFDEVPPLLITGQAPFSLIWGLFSLSPLKTTDRRFTVVVWQYGCANTVPCEHNNNLLQVPNCLSQGVKNILPKIKALDLLETGWPGLTFLSLFFISAPTPYIFIKICQYLNKSWRKLMFHFVILFFRWPYRAKARTVCSMWPLSGWLKWACTPSKRALKVAPARYPTTPSWHWTWSCATCHPWRIPRSAGHSSRLPTDIITRWAAGVRCGLGSISRSVRRSGRWCLT